MLQKVERLRLDLTEALAGGVNLIGASGPTCPVPDVAADAPPTARTAIRRPKLSRGAQAAVDAGLITAETTVLDFGSGNGDDVCQLQAMGIDAVGWDPYREPPGEQRPSDVVLVTNVLNTLYPSVRRQVLTDAIALAREITVVAVPDYQPEGTPKDDGVVTVTGSFQAALDAEAIEAILPEGVAAERLDPRIVAIRREKAPRRGRTLAERDADQALHDKAHATIRRYEEAHRARGIPISAGPKAQRLTNLATNAAQVRASGRKASGGAGRAVEAAIEALEGEIRALEAGSANFELIAHRHTKNGYPIWVAKQRERSAEADFKALKRLAREVAERYSAAGDDRPSGYYSRYAKNGAIPGFTFTSEQAAQAFIEAGDRLLGPSRARDASPAVKSGPKPKAPTKPETARAGRQPYADATRVSKKAAAILEVLTAGMHAASPGPETVVWRRIGEPGAAVMPLSIDRLGGGHFAVAHNFVQNGDLIADPDVEFFRAAADRWIPLAIQQPAGYRRYGEAGKLRDAASVRSGQRDLARFIGSTWMPNVESMLLDRGKLPARRAERLHDGTERELGTPKARDASPAVKSGPAPAAPATPASQPWPEVPDTKAPRTIANLRAVRIAHEAQRSGATPTAEQRRQMLQYSGWGGLSIHTIRDDWPDGIPLPNSRALVHEYYTPWQVCADIVAVVRGLLGEGSAEVLEPSAGIGRFVHAVDFPDWRWTAVELSPLSALILEQTAGPNVDVTRSSFEKWVEGNPGRRFDAVISNPPYGKRGEHLVEDKDKAYRVKAAYQYFVLRGLSLLRPGGVGAFLIPGGFMDGNSTAGLRARVDREADLVAAFRLPSGLFPGARLSLDVVFLRNHGPGASKAPDHVFQVGSYFDDFPHHILGEVRETGRWGASEVIGEYTGLPHFKPRGTQPKVPGKPSDDFPDAIRLDAAFVPLVDLHRRVEAAKNHGGKFRPEDVPAVSDAVWRAAVDDVLRSRRPKKDRLALLRQIIEDLRAAAAKAERFRQSQRTEDADDAVMRVRMGRDAVKVGIAAVKAQGRRRQAKITAEQIAPFARLFVEPPLAQLIEQAEWSALAIPRAQADSLRQVAGLGAVRVVAVDRTHAHIRLTDPGRAALNIEESEFAQQRSRKAARAIEQRGGTVRLRDAARIEGRVAGRPFTLAMPKTVNGHTFGYRVTWDGGNRLLDAQPSKPIAAVEEAFAAMGAAQPKPEPAPTGPEPELPPIADRRRRPKAEAHARALRFASPANRLMEVWHVQGRAIATDNRRLVEVPSDYTGPSQFVDRDGREVPGSWEETPSQIARLLNQVHFTVNPAFHGAFDGKRFRAVVGHRGYTVDPLLRLQLAHSYLAQPGTTPAEAAFLLGFSDQNAFTRAFKGWTGETPVAWRRARRVGA